MHRWLSIVPFFIASLPDPVTAQVAVDIELVLAADSSGSMSEGLRRQQRDGFVQAFLEPRLLEAVLGGPRGRIAVTYVEWAETDQQRVIVP